MKKLNIIILFSIFSMLIWSCQKDELPVVEINTTLKTQLVGVWKPASHQLEYFKLNETIVQRGSDTVLTYQGDSIKGFWAKYNNVPCDTLHLNDNGTFSIDDAKGRGKVKDTTTVVAGAKTTITINERSWSVAEITNQGSSDYVETAPVLKLGTKMVQTVKETGKPEVLTTWWTYKVYTLQTVAADQLIMGYQAFMNVSYKPGVLKGQADQKVNRYVTNTITLKK